MKVGVAASTLDGNANAQGSSSSLARADHTHMIQGVERRTDDPSSGHFVGRLYFNTATGRLMLCVDDSPATYQAFVFVPDATGDGAVLYSDSTEVPTWTDTPAAGEALFWDGATLSWRALPAARVHRTTNQSITNATETAIAFDNERFDTDVIHDNVTNNSRLTCKTAGIYSIGAHIQFAGSAAGTRQVFIRVNGTTEIARVQQINPPAVDERLSPVTLYQLAVNDYVEVVVNQSSGGSLDVEVLGNSSPEFWMTRGA